MQGYKFVLRLALRYFSAEKNNKLVSVISSFSLLGVTIGVAALIVVMAVMEGFHIELTTNMIGLSGDISVISANNEKITNYEEIKNKISKIEGIKTVLPQIQEKALAISSSGASGVLIKAMNNRALKQKPQILNNQIYGDISEIEHGYGVAIGKELAANLRLSVGDELTLICPQTVATMLGNLPKKKTFQIVSIFSSDIYDYDAATVIISMKNAQKLFSMKDAMNYIEIYSNDPTNPSSKVAKISEILGDKYFVSSWLYSHSQFLNALKTERIAMFTILSLIIIVAAFNIVSSLFMLVNEKRKDIAILKTIGASKKQILMIFIINGSIIGFLGTIIGVIVGISFASNIENIRIFLQKITGTQLFEPAIYFLYHLPSKILPENVFLISIMSILISVLATIYPAYKAASLDPAEALRND